MKWIEHLKSLNHEIGKQNTKFLLTLVLSTQNIFLKKQANKQKAIINSRKGKWFTRGKINKYGIPCGQF